MTNLAGFRRRRTPAVIAAVVLATLLIPGTMSATAASPSPPPRAEAASSPEPTTTSSPSPSPEVTLHAPGHAPFTSAIGGAELGTYDSVVVDAAVEPPPSVDARAWVVADLSTGEVLAAQRAHRYHEPADSAEVTGILVALALAPELNADGTLSPEDRQLLAGAVSADDQATRSLVAAAGGRGDALDLIQTEAERLGAFDTRFAAVASNEDDALAPRTSAYDVALFARTLMSHDTLAAEQQIEPPDRLDATSAYRMTTADAEVLVGQRGPDNIMVVTLGQASDQEVAQDTTESASLDRADQPDHPVPLRTASEDLLSWALQTPPTVAAVGRLTTPAEVGRAEAAREAGRSERLARLADPVGQVEQVLTTPAVTSGSVPFALWTALGLAVLAGGAGLWAQRRSQDRFQDSVQDRSRDHHQDGSALDDTEPDQLTDDDVLHR